MAAVYMVSWQNHQFYAILAETDHAPLSFNSQELAIHHMVITRLTIAMFKQS
jgi:hypothetical protein